MSTVKITLPYGEIPVNGKQVSFAAPCACANTSCLQIDGIDYQIVDAFGNVPRNAWAEGSIITVTLDVDKAKAYLQNGASAVSNPLAADFVDSVTTFNDDGSITEVSPVYGSLKTVFNADGSITEILTEGNHTVTKHITFNNDGSVVQTIL